MNLIIKSMATIKDGSAKIAQAVSQAGTEISTELTALPGKVSILLDGMKSEFESIAAKLAEIPGMLNPEPIISPLPGEISLASGKLKDICSNAALIPVDLAKKATDIKPLTDQISKSIQSITGLPSKLMSLLPSIPDKLKPLSELPTMGKNALTKSLESKNIASNFLVQISPLTAKYKGVQLALKELDKTKAKDIALVNDQIAGPLRSQEQDLHTQIQSQFNGVEQSLQALREELLTDVKAMREVISGVGQDLMNSIKEGKDQTKSVFEEALSPLLVAKDTVNSFQAKVSEEAQKCYALFDQAEQTLNDVIAQLKAIIDKAHDNLNDVEKVLKKAGADAQALVEKSLKPIDILHQTADSCVESVNKSISVISEQIDAIKVNLDEFSQQAEEAKTTLLDLPNQFTPVRDAISDAVGVIEGIESQIPGFVNVAIDALNDASSELSDASALCDNAISICTQYMSRAPMLAVAKGLFVGVKATIPGIQTSIKSAIKTINSAGNTATGLMEKAKNLVLALNPLVDGFIAKLQPIIDKLVASLNDFQKGILTAKAGLD